MVNHRIELCSGRWDIACSATIFLLALGLFSLSWFDGVGASVSTIGAERVLRGEIPYRDFWTMYAPGHYYLLASFFWLFGSHILVETVAASVICAVASVLCYFVVRQLGAGWATAMAVAAVLVAAIYNTSYFKTLGTYPPTILAILAALSLAIRSYHSDRLPHLFVAGLVTGAVVVFKHDVGGYTAIAILAGLIARHCVTPYSNDRPLPRLMSKAASYLFGIAAITLPVFGYFALVAGVDMWKDLILFPLTDFRYARPEHYPGFFELDLGGKSTAKIIRELFKYVMFTLPPVFFLCGLAVVGIAVRNRKPTYVACGVAFSVAYVLHYAAAHVQINTHIVSMSVYGALASVLLLSLLEREFTFRRGVLVNVLWVLSVGIWIVSLTFEPAHRAWTDWHKPTVGLQFKKVTGQQVSPALATMLSDMLPFIDGQLPPREPVFIGLHRHDAVIVGANASLYFMIDRPTATRYHELHPAIVDTVEVQQEMIRDLQTRNIQLIVLYRRFADEVLDKAKANFKKNLPNVGAMDLDKFIRENFAQVRELGRYGIWRRKAAVATHSK